MGLKAKVSGSNFENLSIMMAKSESVTLIRLPESGSKWIGKQRAIITKVPFDFVSFYKNKAIPFDCKSSESKSFTHSMINKKPHQLRYLMECSLNSVAGFLVALKNDIIFFHAIDCYEVKKGKSIDNEKGVCLGDRREFSFVKLFKEVYK